MAVDHSNLNDAVDVLIANGADVNALNDDSQTPLFLATSRSQPYIASLLINAGKAQLLGFGFGSKFIGLYCLHVLFVLINGNILCL